jgi:hypothetical protein
MKKNKTRTVTARVIGPIPENGGAFWSVRLKAPYFPFYFDSSSGYATLEAAEAAAEKWRKRKVVVSVTK